MKQLDRKTKALLASQASAQDVINNLSPDVINNLSPDVIKNLSPYVIKNLSPYVINNLSPDVINNLSPDVINNLSPYVINNLSPDVIKNLSEKLAEWDSIPVLTKPYTTLLNDLHEKKRVHQQSTWGDFETWEQACAAENNVCNTPMCTAGHLVHMAGAIGYDLKKKYGWGLAAMFIHKKTYPDYPAQNFGSVPQDYAMAYIEEAVEYEATL